MNSNIYLTNINKRAQCQWNRHYDWIAKKSLIPSSHTASTNEHIPSPMVYRSMPSLAILGIHAATFHDVHLECNAGCQRMQSHQFSLSSFVVVVPANRSDSEKKHCCCNRWSDVWSGLWQIYRHKFESNWWICNHRLSCNFSSKLINYFFYIYSR